VQLTPGRAMPQRRGRCRAGLLLQIAAPA
jgi:hypothetical protein